MSLIRQEYQKEYKNQLQKELGLSNPMQVPGLKKISINMSLSEAVKNVKILDEAEKELTQIAGQKAVRTKAKKAISNFKLKQGMPLGLRVTLRKKRMWAFLDRLIHVSIPKIKDFRGFSPKSFDGRGNYSFGLKDQVIFPEISFDQIDRVKGMSITLELSAQNDKQGRAFLEKIGFPLRKK